MATTYAASRPQINIRSIAVPIILGNFLTSAVAFVALKAVGSLGTEAVAAMLAAERIQGLVLCAFTTLTAGVVAMVSQHWGAKNPTAAAGVARLAIALVCGLSLALTLFTWLSAPMLIRLFGVEGPTAIAATRYLITISSFNIAYGVFQVLTNAFRAIGDAKRPLYALATSNLVNIGLLIVFVHGAWIVPPLGIAGVAWGNGLALLLSAILLLSPWLLARSALPAKATAPPRTASTLIKIGLPAAGQQLIFQSSLTLMMLIVSRYGADAMAAYGVGVNIVTLSYVFGTGFGVASATLAGQYIGAREYPAATRVAWRTCLYAMVCMSSIGLVILVSGGWIGVTLGLNQNAVSILKTFLLIFLFIQPLMAMEFSLQGALRGAGDNKSSMLFTLAGLGTRICFATLAHVLGLGLTWVFLALLVDYALKATLFSLRIRSGRWARSVIGGS